MRKQLPRMPYQIALASATLAVLGCVTPRRASHAATPEAAVFTAVLESVPIRPSGAVFAVALPPLADDPEGTRAQAPDSTAIAAIQRGRRGVLDGMPRWVAAEATTSKCPGKLPGADTQGCPKSVTFRYAVGLSRPGGARSRIAPIEPGLRTVRVEETTLEPTGASWATYDVALERQGAGWRVVARIPLDVIP